jgi:cell division protein FtsW
MSVVTNVIPNTGVTLPFISYGGSSLLFLFAEMGLVLGISRQIVPLSKEEESDEQ